MEDRSNADTAHWFCAGNHLDWIRPEAAWLIRRGGATTGYCEQHAADELIDIALGTGLPFDKVAAAPWMLKQQRQDSQR